MTDGDNQITVAKEHHNWPGVRIALLIRHATISAGDRSYANRWRGHVKGRVRDLRCRGGTIASIWILFCVSRACASFTCVELRMYVRTSRVSRMNLSLHFRYHRWPLVAHFFSFSCFILSLGSRTFETWNEVTTTIFNKNVVTYDLGSDNIVFLSNF